MLEMIFGSKKRRGTFEWLNTIKWQKNEKRLENMSQIQSKTK